MSDDDEGSDDSQSNDDEANTQSLLLLEAKVEGNPSDESGHIELVAHLRRTGDLTRVRVARERWSSLFSLREGHWLEWLEEEARVCVTPNDRERVAALHKRSLHDFLSVKLWGAWCDFLLSEIDPEDSIPTDSPLVENVRSEFENAIIACRYHVTESHKIWTAYRTFESRIDCALNDKNVRISSLYRRQLTYPSLILAQVLEEAKAFFQEHSIDSTGENALENREFESAQTLTDALRRYEVAISQVMHQAISSDNHQQNAKPYEAWVNAIQGAKNATKPQNDATGTNSVYLDLVSTYYERSLTQLRLYGKHWLEYLSFLELHGSPALLSASSRAVHNCYWSAPLWTRYLRALEWAGQYAAADGVVERALGSGLSSPEECVAVFLAYTDGLVRQLGLIPNDSSIIEKFRGAMERVGAYIEQVPLADPHAVAMRYWASVEMHTTRDKDKACAVWDKILESHATNQFLWKEAISLEIGNSNSQRCRELFERASQSLPHGPGLLSLLIDWLRFEAQFGDVHSFSVLESRLQPWLTQLKEEFSRSSKPGGNKRTGHAEKRGGRGGGNKQSERGGGRGRGRQERRPGGEKRPNRFEKNLEQNNEDQNDGTEDGAATHTRQQGQEQDSRKPQQARNAKSQKDAAPSNSGEGNKNDASMNRKARRQANQPSKPQPRRGTKPEQETTHAKRPRDEEPQEIERPQKRLRTDKAAGSDQEPEPINDGSGDEMDGAEALTIESVKRKRVSQGQAEPKVVFASNIRRTATEEEIRALFGPCGEIAEIRMMKTASGLSRGFGFVEFKSETSATAALALNGSKFQGKTLKIKQSMLVTEPLKKAVQATKKAIKRQSSSAPAVTNKPPNDSNPATVEPTATPLPEKPISDMRSLVPRRVAVKKKTVTLQPARASNPQTEQTNESQQPSTPGVSKSNQDFRALLGLPKNEK
eukprot:c10341_g1_i1.p1 GENE.c10341_g1_i1~~c10341_g1_i1.p1  ORF type:complete len:981 (+),score=216.82 c10341_g1_i1:142-2943(+)